MVLWACTRLYRVMWSRHTGAPSSYWTGFPMLSTLQYVKGVVHWKQSGRYGLLRTIDVLHQRKEWAFTERTRGAYCGLLSAFLFRFAQYSFRQVCFCGISAVSAFVWVWVDKCVCSVWAIGRIGPLMLSESGRGWVWDWIEFGCAYQCIECMTVLLRVQQL